ncbi:helix-hairpin-helix domain-containing protein [Aquisalimonas lutea]|uniref:ComEA family DNA-binding protein n=1 Tax=Aquisalimonas lutea TaxID=1327750 RepID=UPI0025B34887|nr:helix-hairpin-helix domain-containing protein [Aquisalimonas lutea]MDN3517692.1 helix-hairpin-helix domain-containing protein [Aquisalimonas lutea]
MWKLIRPVSVTLSVFALTAGVALAETVDINRADADTLAQELDGVGDTRAAAIVDYREANGGFSSVDAITEVNGIGPATLEDNRERMRVGSD